MSEKEDEFDSEHSEEVASDSEDPQVKSPPTPSSIVGDTKEHNRHSYQIRKVADLVKPSSDSSQQSLESQEEINDETKNFLKILNNVKWKWEMDEMYLGFPPPEEDSKMDAFTVQKHYQQFEKLKEAKMKTWKEYMTRKAAERANAFSNINPSAQTTLHVTLYTFPSKNPSKTFKKLCRKGIPTPLRSKVWFECSGALNKKRLNIAEYSQLVQKCHKVLERAKDSKEIQEKEAADLGIDLVATAEEISMDVKRTFSDHPFFILPEVKEAMQRILLAYALRNPSLGYSQNFSYIASIPMIFLSEEDSFWLLTCILEEILPKNFGDNTFLGLRVDQKVLNVLIYERLYKIHTHFQKYRIDIGAFTAGWLLRIFVDVFPIETTLRIWDMLFHEGSKILFRIMLAFLKLNEAQLLKITDPGEMLMFLSKCRLQMDDSDKLVKTCLGFWNLQRKQIETLRAKFTQELMAEEQK